MADVDTDMLAITTVANLGVQVLAHLEAVQVAIQARVDRAAPLLAQRAAIGLAPTGGQGAVTLQQLLVALTLVERAQCLASDDRGTAWRCGVHRNFRAIQRQAFALHRCWQVGLAGGRGGDRRSSGGCDHHWLARLGWLCGLARVRRWGRSGWRNQGGAQVPAVFTASSHAAFEQPVVVGAG